MPGFLKRAEQKLLLNKPLIWSTRVHLVLYYGILFNLLLAGICFLVPMHFLDESDAEYWVGFEIIIAIIAFTVWLIFLLRFNVFKKYGNIKPLHGLVSFLLYFISTGIMVLSVFIYPVAECVRANIAFSDKVLVQDVNNMNIKICQLEHDMLNKKWDYDTVALVRNLKIGGHNPQHAYSNGTAEEVELPYDHVFLTLDTVTFNNRLSNTDSLVKLNDTLFLMYKTPDLDFVSNYKLKEHSREKLLSSFEIYNKALKQPPAASEMPVIAEELNELGMKYTGFSRAEYILYEDFVGERTEFLRRKYHLVPVSYNIDNVVKKKYTFSTRYMPYIIRLFFYTTLGITLLVFIFRHSTVRTFFLSLLSGILLIILTVMVLSFISYNGSASFIGWLIGYALIFFVGSTFTFSATKRRMLNGIFINLFVIIVPILPLLVVDFFYEMDKEVHYKEYGTYDWPYMDQCFLFAEIGGTVLFLVLLATYINKLYRRWYSLPEN
jgi:hypothetical protein